MKTSEVNHEQNVWNLGTGMYLGATALVSFSFLLGLNTLFNLHPAVNSAATVFLALCVGFALAARTSMVEVWCTMEPNGRLAIVIMLAIYFSLACLAPGRWTILAGLLALHIPAAITLVSERGYARLVLLTGLTSAFAVSTWNAIAGTYAIGVFALLLFITLSYESFFFRIVSQPVSTRINSWLPAGLASWRFLLFATPTWLLWQYLPSPKPFLIQPPGRPEEVVSHQSVNPEEFNSNLIKAFLYTMVMVLLLLALIAMLRYLHSKLKSKRGELLPESVGVPIGSPQRMAREEKRRRAARPDDPLEQIVKEYERFSTALRSDLAHRNPSHTPSEFANRLRNLAVVPAPLLAEITSEFSNARYAPDKVTWENAEHFTSLVEQAIRTEQEDHAEN